MERPALVVDAGPLYAYVDADDADHAPCRQLLETHPGPLVAPILAVGEAAYLLGRRLGARAEVLFFGEMAAGTFAVEQVHPVDWARIADLVAQYRNLRLGTADASVVAAAERLRIRRVATLDRRHFGVVRPSHTAAFELVP